MTKTTANTGTHPATEKQTRWLLFALIAGAAAAVLNFYCFSEYPSPVTEGVQVSFLTVPSMLLLFLSALLSAAAILTKTKRATYVAARLYFVAVLVGLICFLVYKADVKYEMEPLLIVAGILAIIAGFLCTASYRAAQQAEAATADGAVFPVPQSVATSKLVVTSLLIAVGILIPLIMPKVVIEPMSFTLASHVAIFLAMFISTDVAVAVVIGTTFGFFVSGFSPVVVARAFSHIVFATLGSLYLKHHPKTVHSSVKFHIFNFVIALVHALCEVVTVFAYYMIIGGMTGFMDSSGFKVLFLLVGLGTLVHSMVDFEIAGGIYQVLNKNRSFSLIFSNVHIPKTDKNNRLVSK